jgi:putative thioredoxin
MSSEFIIEVTEENFQYEVLAYSNNKPVVVEFWAEWSQPSQAVSSILEKLANEAKGKFRLAKVNADDNPKLTMQFKISNLPTVLAFNKGQVVAEFSSAQTETMVREFLRKLTPGVADLEMSKGQSLLGLGEWKKAANSFQKVLKANPDDTSALLGLVKSALAQGDSGKALVILREFPAGKEYTAAEQLLPLAEVMNRMQDDAQDGEADEHTPAYKRAVRLVGLGNLPAAMDGLLGILRTDKNYQDGEARQVAVGVLELMEKGQEETRQYRNELASVLF